MAIQLSGAVRDAQLDAYETAVGTAPKLQIRTGSPPANCAAANTGSLLATISLPSDWMNAASSGSKTKLGTWQVAASGSGTAGHYRLFNTAESTCHEQGTVTNTSGGGDLELDNVSINTGQTVTITTWTRNAGNA